PHESKCQGRGHPRAGLLPPLPCTPIPTPSRSYAEPTELLSAVPDREPAPHGEPPTDYQVSSRRTQSWNCSFPPRIAQSESTVSLLEMPPRGRVSKTNRRRTGSFTCIRWSYTTSRNRSYETAVSRHWYRYSFSDFSSMTVSLG